MMSGRGRLVVVGLGPAGPDLCSARSVAAVEAVPARARYVRTDRHPAVVVVGEHRSCDDLYERADTLEEVYERVVDRLVAALDDEPTVLYAVPGSPLVAERTVELIRERASGTDGFELVVEPALSFLDLCWSRLGVDPLAAGVRLVDGQRFAWHAAGQTGPLLVAQCDTRDVLSDIKLAAPGAADETVVVLQRLGSPDEAVFEVAWHEIDRDVRPDHLTSLYVPALASPVGAELVQLAELMATLRQRCPWDRVQTYQSLRPYVLEEAYEVVEAIDRLGEGEEADRFDELCGELGDLLLQVYFQAEIASGEGWFDLADVARAIHDKLVRRHPHVFGEPGADNPSWDEIKAAERAAAGRGDAPAGPFDDLVSALPALSFASKFHKRASVLGLGMVSAEARLADLRDEVAELAEAFAQGGRDEQADELGDVLFVLAGLAREQGIDAELALRASVGKVRRRLEWVVAEIAPSRLDETDRTTWPALWQRAKDQVG
ncbi:MAG: nucleoside triphosphate pyrophosphohydrolase [Acidimicrobiia bacterium]|nr:nucleoside triphosphate pyrophosphohydrolase [Acidimicrobiia bacterium]